MFVLLEENNGFNDVTQFEIHEEAIGKMPKMYQTNGEKRVRKSVKLQIKKDIKAMLKNMKKTLFWGDPPPSQHAWESAQNDVFFAI